jgi:hypothetical protein
VDISHCLFEEASRKALDQVVSLFGDPVTGAEISNRDLLSAGIASYLPGIVENLLRIGLGRQSKGKQRPRAVDELSWRCLIRAEELVDVHAVALARASLELLARSGAISVDLSTCLDRLESLGSEFGTTGRSRKRATK